ncbi:MAG: MBL fold metallo-hydrolase [Rhodocyclaceae bacterium]|nr:MBL fold metallo-hydrolase [Rhodocyclaceae bacterium]
MNASFKTILMTGAILGVIGVAISVAGCASAPTLPTATSVAAGVTRVDLGDVRVTTLKEGSAQRVLDASFVKNASLEEVRQALAAAGLPGDRVEIPFTVFFVEIGGERVLFDAGNGEFGAATSGKLLESMSKAGIDPASVTAVVISHFHGDHINGLRNKAGELVFKNAKIYVPEVEWNWWMDDARMAAAPEAMKGTFQAARRVFGPIASYVVKFAPDSEVLPGIRAVAAHGHTPGHTAFLVEGKARRLLYWGDTTNIAALFVRHPDWAVMFDMDPEAARQVRRRLAERVLQEDLLLAGYHLPGAAVGTLSRRGSGYEFTPLAP